MKKRFFSFSAALCAAFLVSFFVFSHTHIDRSNGGSTQASMTAHVASSQVRVGTFVRKMRAHGHIGPPSNGNTRLSFADNGILAHINVRIGEIVHAGDILATSTGADMATSALAAARAKLEAARSHLATMQQGHGPVESAIISARTAVRQSEARLALDERTSARQSALYRAGVIARKDLDVSREQITLDRAELQANQAKLETTSASLGDTFAQARAEYAIALNEVSTSTNNLRNTALRAPEDGIVRALLRHSGESVGPTTPIVEISPEAEGVLTLTVPDTAVANIHTGDPVTYTVLSQNTASYGHVVAIAPGVDPSTQTTLVTVDGVPRNAISGEAVNATIDVNIERGLIVPASALVQDPQTGQTFAFIRETRGDGTTYFSPRIVTIADEDDHSALITNGLHPGDVIATQGAFDLLAPSGGD